MSISFTGKAILLDIEGTTSSVSYVFEVLFPFARTHLDAFLQRHWEDPAVVAAAEQIARETGAASLAAWCGNASAPEQQDRLAAEIRRLMDRDVKSTGLKELQGLIWKEGFLGGELRSHVYPDVPPALRSWKDAGLGVWIYSSGSIGAQKLFFGHTEEGDLLPFLHGHFDTTTGPKKEADSYRNIAREIGIPPADILFASDIVAELDAAREAGMQTVVLLRPGNAPVCEPLAHAALATFSEMAVMMGAG